MQNKYSEKINTGAFAGWGEYAFFAFLYIIIFLPSPAQIIGLVALALFLLVRHKPQLDRFTALMLLWCLLYLISILVNIALRQPPQERVTAAFFTWGLNVGAILFYIHYRNIHLNLTRVGRYAFLNLCILIALALLYALFPAVRAWQLFGRQMAHIDILYGDVYGYRFLGFFPSAYFVVFFIFFNFPLSIYYVEKRFRQTAQVIYAMLILLVVILTGSRVGLVLYGLLGAVYLCTIFLPSWRTRLNNGEPDICKNNRHSAGRAAAGENLRTDGRDQLATQDTQVCPKSGVEADNVVGRNDAKRHRSHRILRGILCAALLFAGAAFIVWLVRLRPSSNYGRMDLYLESFRRVMQESPWIGLGINEVKDTQTGDLYGTRSAYLGALYRTGVIGLVVFLAAIILRLRDLFKDRVITRQRIVYIVAILETFLLMVVEDIDQVPWTICFFYIMMAILDRISQPVETLAIKPSLNIAMLGHKHVRYREGGVEVVVSELSTRMVKRGHHVTVYDRGGHHISGKGYDEKKKSDYHGVIVKQVPTINKKGLAAFSSAFFAAVEASFSNADVIHFHAEGPCIMMWLPRLFGKCCVCTIHGIDWQRAKWSGTARKVIRAGERCAAREANEIIVLSRATQTYFQETYHRRTILIPNGVSPATPMPAKEITEKFGLHKDEYFLFLGRIVPEKGVHYLIEAFRKMEELEAQTRADDYQTTSEESTTAVSGSASKESTMAAAGSVIGEAQTKQLVSSPRPGCKLVIAGGSSDTDAYYTKVREMAKDDPNIIFTGYVQGRTLAELYSNAYVYVLPSDLEGMPLTILEAMSYGDCCLVSDIPECAEVVDGHAVIFPHGNVEALRQTLQDLRHHPAEVARYQQEAATYVRTRYNWDQITDATLQVYRGTLTQAAQADTT